MDFLEALKQGPLLFDGGMGTQLIAAGLTTADNAVAWNRDRRDVIRKVHLDYAHAGCGVLTTNTFQGSRTALANHDLQDAVTQLNREGARLAREVADEAGRENAEDCWVAGDIGPFGGFLEPLGETSADQLKEIFVEQLHALRAGGADLALIETMSDPNEASVAVAAAKKVGDWPIVVTFAFQKGGDAFTTMMGSSVEQVVSVAKDAGADAVGANCGTGLSLDDYVQLAEQLVAAAGSTPVIVQPNAGPPRMQGAESVYDAQPSEMAETARRLLAAGVRAVGGCCGTEPRHLAAMADAVREARG